MDRGRTMILHATPEQPASRRSGEIRFPPPRTCKPPRRITAIIRGLSSTQVGDTLRSAVENHPESTDSECPVCLAHMELEDRSGVDWLVCPNGCPTEFEAPA